MKERESERVTETKKASECERRSGGGEEMKIKRAREGSPDMSRDEGVIESVA